MRRVNRCLAVFSRDVSGFRELDCFGFPGREGGDEGTSRGLKYAEGGEELGLMVEANCTRERVGVRVDVFT